MTDLTRRCLILERKQRERLIKILQESLVDVEEKSSQKFYLFLTVAEETFGKGVLTSSRAFPLVLARRFVVWKLRECGYSWHEIGQFIKKDHSSAIHMWEMMDDIFHHPDIFKLEIAYWEEYDKKVKEKSHELEVRSKVV